MNHYVIHNTGDYYNVHYGEEHVLAFRAKGTCKADLTILLDHMNENIDIKLMIIGKMIVEGNPIPPMINHK
jgi:hypothetical protein